MVAVGSLLIVAGCGGSGGRSTPTQPTGRISQLATDYLNELIGLMQENSVNRLKIDWTAFRSSVFGTAGSAQTIPDTFSAIRMALTLLDDGHTGYTPANAGAVIFVPKYICGGAGAGAPAVPAGIGYVKVGAFGGSGAAATAFANQVQGAIIAADRDGLVGWIVDLRGNGGGNMWPMIAGLGPVIGDDLLGYFVDPTGAESPWAYRAGASWLNGYVQSKVDAQYHLRRERPRVAVLIDSGIASSGEATVIAFVGRSDTRLFGLPTCGLSTARRRFTMSDGAFLDLTVSVMADRRRVQYGSQIVPDELVNDPAEMITRAIAWLQSGLQPPLNAGCSAVRASRQAFAPRCAVQQYACFHLCGPPSRQQPRHEPNAVTGGGDDAPPPWSLPDTPPPGTPTAPGAARLSRASGNQVNRGSAFRAGRPDGASGNLGATVSR